MRLEAIRKITTISWKKHRVFSHEGFWKPVPAESVVHVVEDALLPSTELIEFENCSIIENIPPKGERFSDFIATFAISVGVDTYFDLQH